MHVNVILMTNVIVRVLHIKIMQVEVNLAKSKVLALLVRMKIMGVSIPSPIFVMSLNRQAKEERQ